MRVSSMSGRVVWSGTYLTYDWVTGTWVETTIITTQTIHGRIRSFVYHGGHIVERDFEHIMEQNIAVRKHLEHVLRTRDGTILVMTTTLSGVKRTLPAPEEEYTRRMRGRLQLERVGSKRKLKTKGL